MNSNFRTFADFWGFGDPHTKIWFIGVEESGCEVTSQNLQEFLKERKRLRVFKNKIDCSEKSVWNIIYHLMVDVNSEKFSKDYKEKYKKLLFSENHSYFFLTHLFPLPRHTRSKWHESYEKLFGYDKYEPLRYISDVRSYRYPKLYELWDTYKPDVTICFGKQNWDEFTNLFKLGHESFEAYDLGNILYYRQFNIVFTPHFGNGQMKGSIKKELVELIKGNLKAS